VLPIIEEIERSGVISHNAIAAKLNERNVRTARASLSPGAVRMRRYRKQRKQGLRSVRILLDEMDIDALIRIRLLKEDQRQDPKALQKSVLGLLYRAEEDLP
jgi:hypothetical protein